MKNDFTIDTVALWNMINNNRVAECELKRLKGLLDDIEDKQIKKRSYDSLLQDIKNDLTLWEKLGVNNKIINSKDIRQTWITNKNGKTVNGYHLTRNGVIVALGKESSYVKMSVLKHFDSLFKKDLEEQAKEVQQKEVEKAKEPKQEVLKETTKEPKPQEEVITVAKQRMNSIVGKVISWSVICELNDWTNSKVGRAKYINALEQFYFVEIHKKRGYLLTRKTKEQLDQQETRKNSTKTKRVMATSSDNTYSIKFDSIAQAKDYFNLQNTGYISGACKSGKLAYGYYWKYLD